MNFTKFSIVHPYYDGKLYLQQQQLGREKHLMLIKISDFFLQKKLCFRFSLVQFRSLSVFLTDTVFWKHAQVLLIPAQSFRRC